jgi:hypothetical protein
MVRRCVIAMGAVWHILLAIRYRAGVQKSGQ